MNTPTEPWPIAHPTLLHSLRVQARVIHALMMREVITRFGRHNIGVLWLLAEPMMFTVGIAFFWYAAGMNHGYGVPIFAMAISGYSTVMLWRNTVGRSALAIQANLPLLYHRNVKVFDVLVSRFALEVAGTTASFMILSAVFLWGEWVPHIVDPGKVLFGWLMLAWFSLALSMCVGAATSFSVIVERIWHPISYMMFPISGAAFFVDWWAPGAREVLLLNPIVNCVEIIREGYIGGPFRFHYDMTYTAMVNLLLTLAGLLLVRQAAKRTEAD